MKTTETQHYGNEILRLIKNDGQYGGFFNHREYQQLKESATLEQFKEFLSTTGYHKIEVSGNPEETYSRIKSCIITAVRPDSFKLALKRPPLRDPSQIHYGEEFIKCLKGASRYGDIFNYTQYQQLKEAETKKAFASILSGTNYHHAYVYPDPKDTFADIELIDNIEKNPDGSIGGVVLSEFGIIAFPLLPIIIPIMVYLEYRRRKKLKSNRESLWQVKGNPSNRFNTIPRTYQ